MIQYVFHCNSTLVNNVKPESLANIKAKIIASEEVSISIYYNKTKLFSEFITLIKSSQFLAITIQAVPYVIKKYTSINNMYYIKKNYLNYC